ncbi:MAG: hypothetical protein FDZ69_04355 [Deltaproteobacteria bacterium]|nr:MAG: hypothetical protein FDZ69_04355 [Deltaproteobacteria bacterium]
MNAETDAVLWAATLDRARRELLALPPAERDWLAAQVRRIGELQLELDRLFREIDGPVICTDCLGGCCSRAKHHVTLTNLLGYLLQGGTPPEPDHALACPMLGAEGCRLPVERRPFNCIIFLCDRLDDRLTSVQREAFSGIEAELRSAYHAVGDRCPGASLRGLLIAAARRGEQPLLSR